MNFTLIGFNPELIPQINDIADAYKRLYPNAAVSPAESYLNWPDSKENVICALDETGRLCGYAPVHFVNTPDKPYIFWTAIRIDPEFNYYTELQSILLEKIIERASKITQDIPKRKRLITFDYHRSERSNIDFVVSKGGTYFESTLIMERDLSQELPDLIVPDDIEIRYSRLTNENEQKAYLALRNTAYVEGRPHVIVSNSPISLKALQFVLQYAYPATTMNILAYCGRQIVGSVTVFWNEGPNAEGEIITGITDGVFVDEKWRRKGIATCLIGHGLQYFKTHSVARAQLEVNSANQTALNVYQQAGYSVTEENPYYTITLD